ncbi:MAG: class I SAM-dependent methyltransferase [Gammaproteobacteria bacterium]|nr:class I SAM-dependent methyltransferase [Gammaproteobacteria bacterium]MCP4088378.1 class I SAM-dependent methyltransferase [Gammaproteobacteria bacterium]MCP4275083.1 class I SAM-dependent methyltransferase [Gammaproteobacteria bacterium]MCP4830958.1 class I SAM-dependent methyltransferase [Gammaproteobacteria bacterium]MCP4927521.1 class I SAM-dependent methyltransferase [Gammaproteobacteria bacterium]
MITVRLPLLVLALSCLASFGCANEPVDMGVPSSAYRYESASRDGIGKYYQGREISHVMGHQGAGWLERSGREQEERTDLLLSNLPLTQGQNAADVGAGTGYFSLPMAQIVGPEGVVFAVDIQPEMLAVIEQRASAQGISTIELILASAQDPGLPEDSINMALFVDAYHEFEWPNEVMLAIHASLVPGGKVVLIEYRAEDPAVAIKRLHKMTERQVRKEMAVVGFEFVENLTLLPQQHFLIFQKPLAGT